MRCLFVCADDFLWRLAGERGETRLAPVWIVEEPRLRARIEGYLELTELYEVSFSDGRVT